VTTSRVLTRNIFSNWSNLGVNVVVGFLMLPFLVSRLGDSLYGIWVLVVAVVGYGNLLDFGVRSSIVKYVSQRHATNDREGLQRLFNTTLVAYSAIGVVILALAAGAAAFLSQLFVIPSELSAEARVVVVVVGLNLALKFPSGVFEGFLTGLQRYELANAIAIGATLLRASLTVAWLLGGGKLLALAAVGLMTDTLRAHFEARAPGMLNSIAVSAAMSRGDLISELMRQPLFESARRFRAAELAPYDPALLRDRDCLHLVGDF